MKMTEETKIMRRLVRKVSKFIYGYPKKRRKK